MVYSNHDTKSVETEVRMFSVFGVRIGSLDPNKFRNLTTKSLSADTSAVKIFMKIPSFFSRDASKTVANILFRNVEESHKTSWIGIQRQINTEFFQYFPGLVYALKFFEDCS